MEKTKKKRNTKRIIINIIAILCAIGVSGILSFGVLVVGGTSETLQDIWICSAMNTFHHKYLATWFFSDDKIESIMSAHVIDDSGKSSELINFEEKEVEDDSVDQYIEEGYELLEEGIYLKYCKGSTWNGYLMLITDPQRIKLVQTSKQYECGETVMTMVQNNDAIAGINAGGFSDGVNFNSNGGVPAGLLIVDNELVCPQQTDGITYHKMTGFNSKGVLVLSHCTDTWALNNDIVSCVSIFPFLIINGESTIKSGSGGWGLAPRTAIAQRATGEIIFMCVDGRQASSVGCDLIDLINVLLDEKCVNASMMDGGASTAMVYDGEYVDKPCLGHERRINNAWIVTKLPENESE